MLLASSFANISSRLTSLPLVSAVDTQSLSASPSHPPVNTWLGEVWFQMQHQQYHMCDPPQKQELQAAICPFLSLVCSSYSCKETAMSTKRWAIHLGIHNTRRDDVTPPFLFLNVPKVYLDALMIQQPSWSDSHAKNAWCKTGIDNEKPQGALIWCVRHDPDIVAICHVAMSNSTSEHRQHVTQRCKSIQLTSGFSDPSTLRCFFMAVVSVYLSVLPFSSHASSALLFVLSLPDPGPGLQTTGSAIYDPVSDTYPESYPQRASLYLGLSLCSFTELS